MVRLGVGSYIGTLRVPPFHVRLLIGAPNKLEETMEDETDWNN